MSWITSHLWLIPGLPLLAAAVLTFAPANSRRLALGASIGGMFVSFLLSLCAFAATFGHAPNGGVWREYYNFPWFQMGLGTVQLGWLLDPLGAIMLVMVTFVGLLIFIFSAGYMAEDSNFARFFCYLSLFAAAMLGLLVANSLLLLFICWELVGLASYLLIGFWFFKPSAAAAAQKAFITTRIGDIGFLLGILWLYSQSGTLLFYDNGQGCMEAASLGGLVAKTTLFGMAVSTGISLLILCGAIGKSGQFPLHVWLPDAMEGPTPVSALIHAATMVAAGVFMLARVYPLLDADPLNQPGLSTALSAVTWIGAITALLGSVIAVAQNDIKRILAYSTISQLGYMMMGLGVGGPAVAMFHLITHAFFKALLFLGAGSVIHGCHHEQDIRRMGGLRGLMPVTFATYAVGMMALSGVPFLFSGFWSKEEILHHAMHWPVSRWPLCVGLIGAFLTAFYMTRQMCWVFLGPNRAGKGGHGAHHHHHTPHESPAVMTVPLTILAGCAVLIGFVGTPAWPWFDSYLSGHRAAFDLGKLFAPESLILTAGSIIIVGLGLAFGWKLYGSKPLGDTDPLEVAQPQLFRALGDKLYFDELYEATALALAKFLAVTSAAFERGLVNGVTACVSNLTLAFSWVNRLIDDYGVNGGFEHVCQRIRETAFGASRLQNGKVQDYLQVIGVAVTILVLLLAWGVAKP